jgi:hypothetical protein
MSIAQQPPDQYYTVAGFAIPTALAVLEQPIEDSRKMLHYPDNWDGEGSPAYREETWRRAVSFLVRAAARLWEDYSVRIDAPRVLNGPNGSIDLHWTTQNRELLVNVPADPHQLADYYGDDRTGGHRVQGDLDPTEPNTWLLMWLAE